MRVKVSASKKLIKLSREDAKEHKKFKTKSRLVKNTNFQFNLKDLKGHSYMELQLFQLLPIEGNEMYRIQDIQIK